MTRDRLSERPNQRQKAHQGREQASLQPAWRADADQLPHEQAEIEAAGVNQQSLPNVGVAAEVHTTKAAGFIEMGEGPFQALAAEPEQAQAPPTTNAPTITVHRVARFGVLLPVSSAAIGLGDVAAFRLPRSGSEM